MKISEEQNRLARQAEIERRKSAGILLPAEIVTEEAASPTETPSLEVDELGIPESFDDNIKYKDVEVGTSIVSFPYIQTTTYTELTDQGWKEEDIYPNYIRHAQNKNYDKCVMSIGIEIWSSIIRTLGLRFKIFTAPSATSANVPDGFYYLDNHGRIVLNETTANNHSIDADGDRVSLAFTTNSEPQEMTKDRHDKLVKIFNYLVEERQALIDRLIKGGKSEEEKILLGRRNAEEEIRNEWLRRIFTDGQLPQPGEAFQLDKWDALLIKWPITYPPMILQRMFTPPEEGFYHFTKEMAEEMMREEEANTIDDPWDYFAKAIDPGNVGLVTNKWNAKDLRDSVGTERMLRIHHMHQDPRREEDIERGTLHVARATESSKHQIIETRSIEDYSWRVTSRLAPFARSTGRLSTHDEESLMKIVNTDLEKVVKDGFNLNFAFEQIVKPKGTRRPKPVFDYPKPNGEDLVSTLAKLGVLKVKEIPSVIPGIPNSVMIVLVNREGQICALSDVKRGSKLSYAYLLAPVWSIERKQFVSPLEHMGRVLEYKFDRSIKIRNEVGELEDISYMTGKWPRNIDDFTKNPTKTSMMQMEILKYVSEYGEMALVNRKGLKEAALADKFIRFTCVVDFGLNRTLQQKEEIIENINEHLAKLHKHFIDKMPKQITGLTIDFLGTKGSNPDLKKFLFADEWNVPFTASKFAHPARAGKARSQCQRSILEETFRVAFILGETKYQTFITPSGIEKQKTTEGFLPIVLAKLPENYDELPEDEKPLCVEYGTLDGRKRKCYVTNPKASIEIGKLADGNGSKFMPRYFAPLGEQIIDTEGHNIDLLYPMHEVKSKSVVRTYLKKCEEGEILISGFPQPIKCMIGEFKFMRTGDASENIPERWRWTTYKGIDKLPVEAGLCKLNLLPEWPYQKPNLKLATELQIAARIFRKKLEGIAHRLPTV